MRKAWRRAGAIVARIGYFFSCYQFTAFSADVFLLFLWLVIPLYLGWRGWQVGFGWGHFLGIAICLIAFIAFYAVRAQDYVLFFPALMHASVSSDLLDFEETVSLRGSGQFEVSGLERWFIQIPVLLWITELEEYVVMGRVNIRNVPLLDPKPEEQGMWYIFFRPGALREVVSGRLYFGGQTRDALQVAYEDEEATLKHVYLTCDKAADLQRMRSELLTRSGLSES
jgi:hypothetical protein